MKPSWKFQEAKAGRVHSTTEYHRGENSTDSQFRFTGGPWQYLAEFLLAHACEETSSSCRKESPERIRKKQYSDWTGLELIFVPSKTDSEIH